MKNQNLWAILLGLLILGTACDPGKKKSAREQVKFKGKVTDASGEALDGVKVHVNDAIGKTDAEGYFEIGADQAELYILKAKKKGFAQGNGAYAVPKQNIEIRLFAATVKSIDPTVKNTITDNNSKAWPGPALKDGNLTGMFPAMPVVYEDGQIVDLGFSPEMEQAFNEVKNRIEPGPGMSITIPANALFRNGQPPSGNVDVSVSTIDIFSAGAMPGDMTVVDGSGNRTGFMISLGAGSIEVFDEEGEYQLTDRNKATLRIPVDPSFSENQKMVPETIGLFYYQEEKGFWIEEGKATLDRSTMEYVAELGHLSTFNMDFKIPNPSCLQFRQIAPGGSTLSNYIVETILVYGGSPVHTERNVTDPMTSGGWPVGDESPCQKNTNGTGFHMLYNLPEDTEVCLIFYEPASPNNIARGMSITTTGPTYGTTLPTCPADSCLCPDNCISPTSTCPGYDGCTYVPLAVNPSLNVVLAGKDAGSGTEIDFKFVHNESPGAYTYELYEEDIVGGGSPTLITSVTLTPADDPREVQQFTVSGIPAGQHVYTLQVDVGGTIFPSNQLDITL